MRTLHVFFLVDVRFVQRQCAALKECLLLVAICDSQSKTAERSRTSCTVIPRHFLTTSTGFLTLKKVSIVVNEGSSALRSNNNLFSAI
jgi:hypothetical protein